MFFVINVPVSFLELWNLSRKFDEEGIEYRVGSAGGGNQLRQPYVRKILGLSNSQIKNNTPIADHIHFFGMYIGNFPDLGMDEIDWLANIILNV